jgi:hypothetical protein
VQRRGLGIHSELGTAEVRETAAGKDVDWEDASWEEHGLESAGLRAEVAETGVGRPGLGQGWQDGGWKVGRSLKRGGDWGHGGSEVVVRRQGH